jgi:hypothetical protein
MLHNYSTMDNNYILTEEERKNLAVKVAGLLQINPGRLRALLPAEHFVFIDRDDMPAAYGYNVVCYCERNAWVYEPGLLIKLLEIWAHELIIDQLIRRLKQLSPPKYHPPKKPWETCLVYVEVPFISRPVTRHAIEGFGSRLKEGPWEPAARVLVVNGPSKSGKTYTCELIRYVKAMYGPGVLEPVMLDYKNMPVAGFGPAELIGLLLDQVNPGWSRHAQLPVLDNQQEARWIRELCHMLRDEAFSAGKTYCLVLDGFDAPRVPGLVIECIQYLISLAVGRENFDEHRDVLRIVLLGFKKSIPDYRRRVRVDDVTDPGRDDLREFFQCYANYRKVPVSQGDLDTMATYVLNKIGNTGVVPPGSMVYQIAETASLVARKMIHQAS